jgi:ABC-type sugar transport system substrate-binding protein
MAGTLAQLLYEMGWIAVENVFRLAEGRPIPTHIDAPIQMLTVDNRPS